MTTDGLPVREVAPQLVQFLSEVKGTLRIRAEPRTDRLITIDATALRPALPAKSTLEVARPTAGNLGYLLPVSAQVWIPAAAGLLGALIGFASALLSSALDHRRRGLSDQESQTHSSVTKLLVESDLLALRAMQMLQTTAHVASLVGVALRILRVYQPIDLAALYATLDACYVELKSAFINIEIAGDPHTVKLARDVEAAASALLNATLVSTMARPVRSIAIALLGRFPTTTAASQGLGPISTALRSPC